MTNYARPQGTREALAHAIEVLKDIKDIRMPDGFFVKVDSVIFDMETERNRKEGDNRKVFDPRQVGFSLVDTEDEAFLEINPEMLS